MKVIKHNGQTDDESLLFLANKSLKEAFSIPNDNSSLISPTLSWVAKGVAWAPNESMFEVKLLNIEGLWRNSEVVVSVLFAVCEENRLLPFLVKVLWGGIKKDFQVVCP